MPQNYRERPRRAERLNGMALKDDYELGRATKKEQDR
jgi:hypothetical protein